jgi:two-component system response regulator PilR (NtrC family)
MPPLRERPEDVHLLAMYFLNKAIGEQKTKNGRQEPLRLSKEARAALLAFDWPGNIRQLEQAVLAAAAVCEGDEIQPEDFPGWLHQAMKSETHRPTREPATAPPEDKPTAVPECDTVSNEDRALYLEVLDATKYAGTGRWNLSAASRELGIPRKTFTYRLKRLGLIK